MNNVLGRVILVTHKQVTHEILIVSLDPGKAPVRVITLTELAMSKCMMSWCGGEREGRDMGGALATPPRENMESPDLRWEPVHSTLVHMGLTWPVPPSSRSAWCPHQRRSLGMRHTSTLCLTRQKMFQGFYQWLNDPLIMGNLSEVRSHGDIFLLGNQDVEVWEWLNSRHHFKFQKIHFNLKREHPLGEWKVIPKLNQTGSLQFNKTLSLPVDISKASTQFIEYISSFLEKKIRAIWFHVSVEATRKM